MPFMCCNPAFFRRDLPIYTDIARNCTTCYYVQSIFLLQTKKRSTCSIMEQVDRPRSFPPRTRDGVNYYVVDFWAIISMVPAVPPSYCKAGRRDLWVIGSSDTDAFLLCGQGSHEFSLPLLRLPQTVFPADFTCPLPAWEQVQAGTVCILPTGHQTPRIRG